MAKNLIPGRNPNLPPSKGPKAVATVTGQATEKVNTDGGRIRQVKEINATFELPFEIGDGRATVSSTRGFKNWFSTRDAGLTVESTVSVSVTCNQDASSIIEAIQKASMIAEEQAKIGAEEMGGYLKDFGGR